MRAEAADTLQRSGLDTLPAESLMRLVRPFTGELHRRSGADTLAADSAVVAAEPLFGCGTASESTFRMIVGQWRRAREVYRDGDAAAVFGAESAVAYGATAEPTGAGEGDTAADSILVCGGADSAAQADSTVQATRADSLLRDAAIGGGDTLLFATDADSAELAGALRPVRGDSLTAAQTVQTAETVHTVHGAEDHRAWASTMLDVLTVGVLLAYMFCLYRYFDDVVALLRSVFRRSVMPSGRVVERRRSEIFYGFLGKLFMLGTAFVAVFATGWAVQHADSDAVSGHILYTPLAAVGAFFAVVVLQYAVLAGMGAVTRSIATVRTLLRIRLIYFVLATVMAAPVALIAQTAAGTASQVWFAVCYTLLAVAVLFFLRESVMLFITKKISILHWFLYLCTIEILPLSLLWQAAVRLRL